MSRDSDSYVRLVLFDPSSALIISIHIIIINQVEMPHVMLGHQQAQSEFGVTQVCVA